MRIWGKLFGIWIVLCILFTIFCSSPKEKAAKEIYDRICSSIRNGSEFTDEWKRIQEKALLGKDTLFLIENQDFKIMVALKNNRVADTISKTVSSTDSADSNISSPQPNDVAKGVWQ